MSDKPTTGEQIAKRIADECVGRTTFDLPHASEIINAALAAEREKVEALMDALKEIKAGCGMPDARRGKAGSRLVKILNLTVTALAKIRGK